MKTFLLVFVLFYLPLLTIGQPQDVADNLNDAYENFETAYKKAKGALSSIDDCYSTRGIENLRNYARDAEDAATSAKKYSSYAEDEADDAEEAANFCSNAEDEANDAEDYFYQAKRKFSSAADELSNISYEDNIDNINSYLQNAVDFLQSGIKQLNYGVDEINNTFDALKNDCR